ncbi:MAG: DUF3109 family protein [Bacteroidaceae bacterium]|nr:DUF3109 family protein [Bacteroidaceae bacterium]
MLEIQDTLISLDLFSQQFCCDLERCRGCCCEEGDAGAPVAIDEVAQLEDAADKLWDELTPEAQEVIVSQGVVYNDITGELVTSIVGGRDCVFATHDAEGHCLCVIDRAYRQGRVKFQKPISCHLYPVRLKTLSNGTTALNYDRWDICQCAVEKGCQLALPLYKFLKEPLIRRFGEDWYREVETAADELKKANMI